MASPTKSPKKGFFGFGSSKEKGEAEFSLTGSPQSGAGARVDKSIAGASAELRQKLKARRRVTVADNAPDVEFTDDEYAEGDDFGLRINMPQRSHNNPPLARVNSPTPRLRPRTATTAAAANSLWTRFRTTVAAHQSRLKAAQSMAPQSTATRTRPSSFCTAC